VGYGHREGRAREARVLKDECGTHASMAPIYGYAPRGERLRHSVPRRRGKNTTLLSSMTLHGMGPSLAVEGATTAVVFGAYVEKVLSPSLCPGQVVVMDNLGAHRPKRVRELIEERGCELVYLPSYSPELNPMEEAFAKGTPGGLLRGLGPPASGLSSRCPSVRGGGSGLVGGDGEGAIVVIEVHLLRAHVFGAHGDGQIEGPDAALRAGLCVAGFVPLF
jgi:hypothetical protein